MKPYYSLSAKDLGLILIALAIVLSIVFASTTSVIMGAADAGCECSADGAICPHEDNFPLQSYLGFSLAIVLGALGALMVAGSMSYQVEATEKTKKHKQTLASLQGDEQKLCEIIKESDGAVFQSELVEKSNLTKVKVSRTLDKLEGKGIIERRRRGMTNLVLLK